MPDIKSGEPLPSRYILPLDSPDCTLSIAGGKGANLSRLAREGFPVPPGCVVTTDAYRAFIQANGLDSAIEEVGRAAVETKPDALEAVSERLRSLFEKGSIPEDVRQEILRAYSSLSARHSAPVAVRSSANAEDLPHASFAGQQETYLNICGELPLLAAVKRCWSSLWTARALAYRAVHSIPPMGVTLAVVLQEMVPAIASGVLFTLNPMNGSADEMVVNAAWGLGEAVVGGLVTPDSFIVDKSEGRLKHSEIADKEVMIAPSSSGTSEVSVAADRRLQAALTDEQLASLIKLGKEIEASFGAPQDIEWAVTEGGAHILQARPITASSTLNSTSTGGRRPSADAPPPGDDNWPVTYSRKEQPFDQWTRANVGELWPDPVSPLIASVVPEIIAGALRFTLRGINAPELTEARWAGRFFGRIYYNEGALRRIFWKELGLPASYVDRGRGNRQRQAVPFEDKFRPWTLFRRLPVLARLALRQWVTGKELDAFIPQVDRWLEEFEGGNYTEYDDRELWRHALIWLDRIKEGLRLQNELTGYSLTAVTTLERLTGRWLNRRDLVQDLISGIPGIQAAEMGAALFQIAAAIRDAGLTEVVRNHSANLEQLRRLPAAAVAIRLLDAFLREHGHRCLNEAEWLNPRWAEAPDQVIELLGVYLGDDHPMDPAQAQRRQQQRREEAVAWVEARLGPIRRALFHAFLVRTHHAARLRDNGKSSAIKAALPARRIVALWGERWVKRGWLQHPDDIFYLTMPEIQQVIERGTPESDLKPLVSARREVLAYWHTVEAPEILNADGRPAPAAGDDGSSPLVLRGISASNGRFRGKARVILDAREVLTVRAGEILVTRATDAGWTSVFPLLGGLVTEIGGQLSHAAILAREYGLPAVVDVRNATKLIADGQTVTVDGSTAEVYLEGAGAE